MQEKFIYIGVGTYKRDEKAKIQKVRVGLAQT